MTGWTEDRIAKLREMWAAREPASTIAETLAITRNAVLGKVFRLGLSESAVARHEAARRKREIEAREKARKESERSAMEKARKSDARRDAAQRIREAAEFQHALARLLPVVAPAPIVTAPAAEAPVSFADLRSQHCLYIVGEDDDGLALFCGVKRFKLSFCEAHFRLCYQPGTARAGLPLGARNGTAAAPPLADQTPDLVEALA